MSYAANFSVNELDMECSKDSASGDLRFHAGGPFSDQVPVPGHNSLAVILVRVE